MDDLELEARLRTRLHARFDETRVPPDLASSVAQVLATPPVRVGFDLRSRGRWLGWSAVAAAVALAVIAITVSTFKLPALPGGKATPSPAASMAAERHFILLPPGGVPAKPDTSLAGDVMAARLRALGIGNFSSGAGYAITFIVPADGPSDESIRVVLAATGDVEFVPLPAADYGDGLLEAVVGKPLPKDEPALFGWEGIETAAIDDSQQIPAVTVTLKPAAKDAFADYTTAHARETFAIILDGRVASLPIINEPITGGQVTISGPSLDDGFARMAAIMVGGMLPEAWRGAEVPAILQPPDLAAAIARDLNGATVESADLDAIFQGGRWVAVWRTTLGGGLPHSCPALPVDGTRTCPPIEGSVTYTFDAETGVFILSEPSET